MAVISGGLAPVVGPDRRPGPPAVASPPSASALTRRRCSGSPLVMHPRHRDRGCSCCRWRSWASATPSCGRPLGATATRNLPLSSGRGGLRRLQHDAPGRRGARQRRHRRASSRPGWRPTCPACPAASVACRAPAPPCRRGSPTGSPSAMSESMLLPAAVLVVGRGRGALLRAAREPPALDGAVATRPSARPECRPRGRPCARRRRGRWPAARRAGRAGGSPPSR